MLSGVEVPEKTSKTVPVLTRTRVRRSRDRLDPRQDPRQKFSTSKARRLRRRRVQELPGRRTAEQTPTKAKSNGITDAPII